MTLQLLLVENEEPQAKLLRDAVDLFNKTSPVKIALDEAQSLKQGLDKLHDNSYDGAVVDLRLEQHDEDGQGNVLLKEIKAKSRFPVKVISGHLGDLDPELRVQSYLFKCHNRGEEDYDKILSEFVEIYSTGITKILNNKGLIETSITSIFWKHIAEVLPEFVKQKAAVAGWDGERVLLRYISSHILEYLEITIDNNLEPVFNIEFYIKPPVKEKLFTGDIIKFVESNKYGIILTPACDLATDEHRKKPKAKFVTVACIYDYDAVTTGRSENDVNRLKGNSLDLKFHFLPKTILFQGGFINFQHIESIPIADFQNKEKLSVECVVTNPFRKDIISRFANYFSRQGQPSFS